MATLLEEPRWLTVKQAARRLGLHEITVRRKIHRGELPALQLGGRGTALRILEDELHRFIYGSPHGEVLSDDGSQRSGSFAVSTRTPQHAARDPEPSAGSRARAGERGGK